MQLEPQHLENVISGATGLEFEASTGKDADGQHWYLLRPRGLTADHTFGIRTTLGWRRLQIDFEPGKFAGTLLADMGKVDVDGRAAFRTILDDCRQLGASIEFEVNGVPLSFDNEDVWSRLWQRLVFSINKGQLELGADEGESDAHIVCRWTGRFAAAVVAILPVEENNSFIEPDIIGYPEGALSVVKVNRFERDRRNRAAAVAIHGTACKACGLKMGDRYGSTAEGFVEIHHVTPVSELETDYVIDPVRDLVPLCPNCHSVAHRRNPPLTAGEIEKLIIQR